MQAVHQGPTVVLVQAGQLLGGQRLPQGFSHREQDWAWRLKRAGEDGIKTQAPVAPVAAQPLALLQAQR